jgi:hypothetical protein
MVQGHPQGSLLYRYNTRESIEALTRDGIIWLGTLHGFRSAEGKMIADKEEGKLVLTEEIADYTVNTKGAVLTRMVFGEPHPNKIVRGNRITQERETHNLWCYCTSHSLKSLAEVQEWAPTYNACAVIHRPEDFMVLIANALEPLHPLKTVGIYPIVYRKREYEYAQHDGTDPALIKDPFFSSQDEIRFIFESWERPQKAVRLHIPELVACCRILEDEEVPK